MSTTEELGLRVTLTGQQAAAAGLKDVATAEDRVADGARRATTALGDNKVALDRQSVSTHAAAEAQRGYTDRLAQAAQGLGSFGAAGNVVTSMLSSLRGGALLVTAAFAGMAALNAFGQMQDDARVTLARIQGITGSLAEARVAYRGLADDAVRLRVTQDAVLQGYTRIAGAVLELNGTSTQARQINEIVLATAKASGIAQDEAAAAARQFAQALGSGVLQGDELRSIMENNQELARQLAKGLGVSVSELRKLGEEGKLTADVVANALLSRLPEIRAKLADVPLTSADAWGKLTTVLNQWVFAGDQVEMKAGLIARAMNAIAEGIDRSRKAAEKPIVLEVRTVSSNEGGAAFVGPSQGRRDPAKILEEQNAAIAAGVARRGNALAELRAKDNDFIAASRLGIEAAGKVAIKEYEKYADGLALASERIQKDFDKHAKVLAEQKAKLTAAISSGDPRTVAIASKQLAELETMEVRTAADVARKVAEARKSEANKAGAEAKAASAATYREAIAQEEAYQAQLTQVMNAESAALKRQYDQKNITAQQYYASLAAMQLTALAQQEESVRRELEVAEAAVRRGDATRKADVAKYLGELRQFADKRIRIAEDTEDAITAIEKRALAERERAIAEANQHYLAYLNTSAELVRQLEAENEQRQFELSLIGQTEQVQARMQAARAAELTQRRALTQAYKDYIAALDKSISQEQDNAITDRYNATVKGIKDATAAQGELNVAVAEGKTAYDKLSSTVDGFIDAAMGGFGSLKDWLKRQFFEYIKSQVLKPLIMQIVVNVTGGITGGGGLSGILGSLFGGGSAGGLGGIFSSLLGGGGGGGLFGSILGTMPFVGGAGPIAAGTGLAGLASSLGLEGLATGIAQFANFIPVIGPLVAIAATLLPALLKNKDGLWFDINGRSPGGHPENQFTTALGSTIQLHGQGKLNDLAPWVAQVQNLAQNFVDIFGPELAARASASVNTFWTGYSERGRGTEYENGQEYAAALATESRDVMAEYFGRVFSVVNDKIAQTISTWSGTTEDLTKYIQGVLAVQQSLTQQAPLLKAIIGESIDLTQIVDLQREGESLADTFSRVLNTFTLTNQIAQLMGKSLDAFGAVGMASLEARERLIALAGGIQALSKDVSFYLDQFFTDAERGAMAARLASAEVTSGFSALGLAVPTTRAAFRAMIDGLDLSTESGQRLYVALLRLAPALDTLFDAAENVGADGGPIFTIIRNIRSMGPAVVNTANLIEGAVNTINAAAAAISIGQVLDAGSQQAQALMQQLFAIIDSTGESLGVKLQRKLAASAAAAAQLDAQYQAMVAAAGGNVNADALVIKAARDAILAQQAALAGNLALLTTLQAQYGLHAEQMYELELWRQDQIRLANGNAATLLLIEQSYNERRNAILTSGVASGLSSISATLQDWLNNLLLNNQLSTLTPAQQLAEARAQYEAALASGDASAITQAADAYLRIARDYFASGDGYNQIFNAVRAQVQALINGTPYVPASPGPAPTPAPAPSGGGDVTSGGDALRAVTATAAAAASGNARSERLLDAIAQLIAESKKTAEREGAAMRDTATATTERLVEAIAPAGLRRAEV